MELIVHPGPLAVCSLPPDAPWPPEPAVGAWLFSATRTPTELSIVCPPADAPAGAAIESGWRALQVAGSLDFDLIGVLATLSDTLARASVSIFVLSTYATDAVLVKEVDLDRAVSALVADGHTVWEAPH
jgi:hypothetical protein